MAKSITVEWYDKVLNVTATLQSGGSLEPNTTYYIRVYATNSYDTIQGEISDEISFTTTDTEKSALISWDPAPNAPYYAVLQRTDAHSDYNFYGGFIKSDSNSLYYTTDQTSYLYDGTAGYYTPIHPFLSTKEFPFGLNKNKGRALITISGSSETDPCLPQDVHDAIVAAGLGSDYHYWDDGTFAFIGSLYFVGGGNRFYCQTAGNTKSVFMLAGLFLFDSSNDNVVYIGADDNNYPVKLLLLPHGFMRPYFTVGKNDVYLTNVQVDAVNVWYSGGVALYPFINQGGLHLNNTFIYTAGWSLSIRSASAEMSNTFMNHALGFSLYTFNNDCSGVVDNTVSSFDLFGAYDGVRVHRNTVFGYWSSKQHLRVGSYTVGNYSTGDDGLRHYYFRDVVFTTTTDNIPTPQYYRDDPNLTYPDIYCETTKSIRVADEDGAPIEGASVTIESAHETISGTTDANGDVTLYPVFGGAFPDFSITDPESWHCRKETYAPFKITITKKGYEDYVDVYIDLNNFIETKDVTFRLLKNAPVRPTTSGRDAIALQPSKGSRSVLEVD